jgi:enoyl-CoA hydratase/carnithine racemase
MMSYKTILMEVKDRIAVITLNRPEVLNAWNSQMAVELSDAFSICDKTDDVRAVVVTGNGRAFCAGADLGSGGDTFSAGGRDDSEWALGFPEILPWHLTKPVLAAINGHAIGVGITFPMTCDIRFVAEDAKVQFAFVRRGVIPELASHVIVQRVAGLSNAADLLLSGRMISGRELTQLGLASVALPADQVLDATIERAREFLMTAPVSVAISKRLLWDGLTSSVSDMVRREFEFFRWVGEQADAREGVESFLEKRRPIWKLSPSRDLPDGLKL